MISLRWFVAGLGVLLLLGGAALLVVPRFLSRNCAGYYTEGSCPIAARYYVGAAALAVMGLIVLVAAMLAKGDDR